MHRGVERCDMSPQLQNFGAEQKPITMVSLPQGRHSRGTSYWAPIPNSMKDQSCKNKVQKYIKIIRELPNTSLEFGKVFCWSWDQQSSPIQTETNKCHLEPDLFTRGYRRLYPICFCLPWEVSHPRRRNCTWS